MCKSRKSALWFASTVFVLFAINPAAALEPCDAPTAITSSTQAQNESKTHSILSFTYQANFKGCGIVSWIGTRGRTQEFRSPAELGLIQVHASSLTPNSSPPGAILSRQLLRFVTKQEQNSWVSFDFGANAVRPSHYTLRHYSSWDTEALRNWVFEASLDEKSWTLLREHTNDPALNGKGDSHTWALSGPNVQQPYRYFRIRQTGLNSNNHYYLALSGFEIYGQLE